MMIGRMTDNVLVDATAEVVCSDFDGRGEDVRTRSNLIVGIRLI